MQDTQLEQVVNAILIILDVTVKHGGIRLQPDLMRQACRVQPLIAINLVVADDMPHAIGKDLGAAAWQRVHTRSLELG